MYNLIIRLLQAFVWIASKFHPKSQLFVTGRINLLPKLKNSLKSNTTPLVWVHCASLGEFEQGRPVMESIKKDFPHYKILLTFFSPSGYEVRKNYSSADWVTYLPWDTKSNAKKFIEITKPSLVLFVKYEFWHNYSDCLRKAGIPLLSISSIFRNDQIYLSLMEVSSGKPL